MNTDLRDNCQIREIRSNVFCTEKIFSHLWLDNAEIPHISIFQQFPIKQKIGFPSLSLPIFFLLKLQQSPLFIFDFHQFFFATLKIKQNYFLIIIGQLISHRLPHHYKYTDTMMEARKMVWAKCITINLLIEVSYILEIKLIYIHSTLVLNSGFFFYYPCGPWGKQKKNKNKFKNLFLIFLICKLGPVVLSDVLISIQTTSSLGEGGFVEFSNFHGVNSPTVLDFELPVWCH